MNILVFDIETIPDVEGGKRVLGLSDVTESESLMAMSRRRRQETNGTSDFIRHHLHKVIAISVAMRTGDEFRVWSLGSESSSESELIKRFFEGIEKYTPVLVSWNGNGFDLPVLHYRALINSVVARAYWDDGIDRKDFRYDNYLSRFHKRHLDLMDSLAGYQSRAYASLDQIATLMGFPGKLGISGSDVLKKYLEGDLTGIRDYCETDVLNTWLVYLRFEYMRGRIDSVTIDREIQMTKSFLKNSERNHFHQFLSAWGIN